MRARTASQCPDPSLWLLALLFVLLTVGLTAREAGATSPRFVRVKVEVANLRARPSTEAELIRQAYENEPLRVVGSRGQWLRVRDVDDQSAWVYRPLIDGRPAVVVVRDLVNVRAEPGTEHAIVFTAERGVNLLVLDRAGEWLRVRHEVGEGWLHDSLVWGTP
jgi:SH3-like domain-containing protein